MRYAALGLGHVVVAPATFLDSTCPHDVDTMLTQATSCQHTVNTFGLGQYRTVVSDTSRKAYRICARYFLYIYLALVQNPMRHVHERVLQVQLFKFENCAIQTLLQTVSPRRSVVLIVRSFFLLRIDYYFNLHDYNFSLLWWIHSLRSYSRYTSGDCEAIQIRTWLTLGRRTGIIPGTRYWYQVPGTVCPVGAKRLNEWNRSCMVAVGSSTRYRTWYCPVPSSTGTWLEVYSIRCSLATTVFFVPDTNTI